MTAEGVELRTRGEIAAEISNGIVKLFSEYYGRGPVRAKTFLMDNYSVTVLENTLTTAEQTLVKADDEEMVRAFRLTFQKKMAGRFKGVVELATKRRVLTYQSQIMFDPEHCIEFFVLDGPPKAADAEADAQATPQRAD